MKNVRRGLGKGLGTGYKNLAPMDSHIHSLSAKGVKSFDKYKVNPTDNPITYRKKKNMFYKDMMKQQLNSYVQEKYLGKYSYEDLGEVQTLISDGYFKNQREIDEYIKDEFTQLNAKGKEPKRYPKPKYSKCNAGHQLVEVYDEKKNAFVWDCPTCIRKMDKARRPQTLISDKDAFTLKLENMGYEVLDVQEFMDMFWQNQAPDKDNMKLFKQFIDEDDWESYNNELERKSNLDAKTTILDDDYDTKEPYKSKLVDNKPTPFKEYKNYSKELGRRIKALSKFTAPAFKEERVILKSKKEWVDKQIKKMGDN